MVQQQLKTLSLRYPPFYRVASALKREVRRFLVWRRTGLSLRNELAAYRSLRIAGGFKPLPRTRQNIRAFLHVGTEPAEGIAQLASLIHHGCKPHHKVLEIGCGALNAGYPIIQYLESGNYCGIDPETWAREESLALKSVAQTVSEKNARFDSNLEFDGSGFGEKFDFVLSHSVLSHAAHWQLPQFLKNVAAVTQSGSKVLASLHFTEGNNYGGPSYSGTELDFKEWVYPGNSFFRTSAVMDTARTHGYRSALDLASAFLVSDSHGAAVHSWVLFEKV